MKPSSAKIATKNKVATFKITPEQHKLISQRAERCGVKMSFWIRSILIQSASQQPRNGHLRIREPNGVSSY